MVEDQKSGYAALKVVKGKICQRVLNGFSACYYLPERDYPITVLEDLYARPTSNG
jgi:hypothetical protein